MPLINVKLIENIFDCNIIYPFSTKALPIFCYHFSIYKLKANHELSPFSKRVYFSAMQTLKP